MIVGDEASDLKRVAADPATIDDATRSALERGESELVRESEFWARLGLVDSGQGVERLYTPAMLAELIGVPISAIRHWSRRGALRATREVRRLPYFDFEEVGVARKLAQLLAAGCSLSVINRKLDELARLLPEWRGRWPIRPWWSKGGVFASAATKGWPSRAGSFLWILTTLSRERSSDASESGAGRHSDCCRARFEVRRRQASRFLRRTICVRSRPIWNNTAIAIRRSRPIGRFLCPASSRRTIILRSPSCCTARATCRRPASDTTWRSSSTRISSRPARIWAACWPSRGSWTWPRPRFVGALKYHPNYADAHYHLARLLDRKDQSSAALRHWQRFMDLAPASPWADEARERVGGSAVSGVVE